MRRLALLVLSLVCLLVPARAEQVRNADTTLTIVKDGNGFIDALSFRGRNVVQARAGQTGAIITLAAAGDGSAASLFAPRVVARLPATIDELIVEGNTVTVRGQYRSPDLRIPFTRTVSIEPGKAAISVREQADFSSLPAQYLVAEHRLDLPLVVCEDPHLRMYAFGGERRTEMFRMDQNDVRRSRIQLISSARGHWPYWDRAGVLQLPQSYTVWKANHADTMAYPIEQGNGAPSWADYSELEWGITASVADPVASAPWDMTVDARNGVFSFGIHPSSQLPVAASALGRRTFGLELIPHERSWPTKSPCELDFALYQALLESMGNKGAYPFTVLVGTPDIPTIIFRERVQPSTILRGLYAGDGWRMAGLMKSIGKTVPRSQPMDKWEKDAQEYLAYIRKNGLPKKQ